MKKKFLKVALGAPLAARWLRRHTPIAGGTDSTPGRSHMLSGAAKKRICFKKKELI